jgi:succinate-semialdehyde dehydrogenase/glutarate-semialdehyde dehydrogenase
MDIRKTRGLSDILKDKSLLKDKCYIDGKWLGAAKSIDVTNPVNESVIGSIPFMGRAETKQAIEAAERAQKDWARKTAKERAGLLRKWFTDDGEPGRLGPDHDGRAGKPCPVAGNSSGRSFIESLEEARRIYGETILAIPRGIAVIKLQALWLRSRRGISPTR